MTTSAHKSAALFLAVMFACAGISSAADWPAWRHDAQRSSATDEELAATLHLQWTRALPPMEPTWPDDPRLAFDPCVPPVAAGGMLFVAVRDSDKLLALDAATGDVKWTFFAGGPVRYAPVVWKDRVIVGSDDGFLYALDAATGKPAWKFPGGPGRKTMLGHGRLISRWPISAGPALVGDTVYVTAGVWPFMGIFVHALDAATGKVLWTNDGSGFLYRAVSQGHPEGLAITGPAPQGYLAVAGDSLLVPCGRSLPACFDRRTGKLLYYEPTAGLYYGGPSAQTNSLVTASGDRFFSGLGVFDAKTGQEMGVAGPVAAITEDLLITSKGSFDLKRARVESGLDWRKQPARRISMNKLFDVPADVSVFLKAGSRLYGASKGKAVALSIPEAGGKPSVTWSAPVDGTPAGMIASDGRIYVSTREGKILCFGPKESAPATLASAALPLAEINDAWTAKAREILDGTGTRDGYGLILGVGSGRLIEELVRQSKLTVIALDPDAGKVAALRKKMDDAGLYGTRVAAIEGDLSSVELPPYFASLVVTEGPAGPEPNRDAVLRSMRPYGGAAWLGSDAAKMTRPGPLAGAGRWTHDNADPARTLCSHDSALKPPMAVLWYGDPAGAETFIDPGWLGGPSPLVCGGRMFVQGRGDVIAIDVYTGRMLWKSAMAPKDPSCATRYVGYSRDYAFNWAAADDALYVANGDTLVTLDPATGRRVSERKMPADAGQSPAFWGNVLVVGDTLVAASCRPVALDTLPVDETRLTAREIVRALEWVEVLGVRSGFPYIRPARGTKLAEFADANIARALGTTPFAEKFPTYKTNPCATNMDTADRIMALDRKTGAVLWTHDLAFGTLHNSAFIAAAGKVFCVDGYSLLAAEVLARRGKLPADYAPAIVALDLRTGAVAWTTTKDVFPAGGLAYSDRAGLLYQARGALGNERVARSPADGSVVWKKSMEAEGYGSWHPSIIRGGDIIDHLGQVYDAATGQRRTFTDPLTGRPAPWTVFTRSHGCGHAVASEDLVTMRPGNAAYVDLAHFDGTRSLGGFRSGCQNSLIPADGVLASPRYSDCRCAYPIYASLALVNDPDVETWSFYGAAPSRGRVLRVGLNLGAPGDRLADDGTLWLDCPSVGGPSPSVPVEIEPKEVEWFRHYPGSYSGDALPWVASSGCAGVRRITITLAPDEKDERVCTVRLTFAEPEDAKPGERVFDVAVQGKKALAALDVVKEAGGPKRGIVREVRDVKAGKDLVIELTPAPGSRPAVLSGIEVLTRDDKP